MKNLSVGITATHYGATSMQLEELRKILSKFKIMHHGDCIGGDEDAHNIAAELGMHIVIHPPINPAFRANCQGNEIRDKRDYIARNHDIVDETEELIAMPATNTEELRSGTWATIRYARRIGRKVTIIWPNGKRSCLNERN